MKRLYLTKFAAVIAATLVLTAAFAAPITAANTLILTPCTAEADGSTIPFDTITSSNEVIPGTDNAIVGEDNPGTADDIIGGDPALPENPSSSTTPDSENSADNTMNDSTTGDNTAGRGDLEDGQAGGDENGIVGEGTDNNIVEDITDSGTAAADTADGITDETASQDDGMNWASIIIALVIAIALIVVIVALIPRKRTD